MMGIETGSIRCSLNKRLPFDALRRELNALLKTNKMSGVIKIAQEDNLTFKLAYENYGLAGVKSSFQMVCNSVDHSEAMLRGDWTAHYPPVEIKWFE